MSHITISSKRGNKRVISTPHPWFSGRVIIKADEDGISFRKPTLGYMGKTYACTRGRNRAQIHPTLDLPIGRFEIDEEDSTEDQIVVWFDGQENTDQPIQLNN